MTASSDICIAAQLFFDSGVAASTLEEVPAGLAVQIGAGAAVAFAVALLASGLAASAVGTYAGQAVMAGFLRRRIPVFVRRLITASPPLPCWPSARIRPRRWSGPRWCCASGFRSR